MDCTAQRLPYRQTGYFTKTILEYIDQSADMKPFVSYPPSLAGIKQAIAERKKFNTDRAMLVQELKKQYAAVTPSGQTKKHIEDLLSPDTFTITTAHQNNIFTGPLYFIYKILHTVRVAAYLKESLPDYNFVPVFYMGSEDADLDELNHIYIDGEKKVWATKQTGAVGRMKVDKELTRLLKTIEGQLGVQPHGKEILDLLKACYQEGDEIQQATFKFINALFGEYGIVVLLPDNAALKKQLVKVFEDDLLHQQASGIVETTASKLDAAGYKVQANPREINLFYLEGNIRERIEKVSAEGEPDSWRVLNTDLRFSKEELLNELKIHPERFSPNVILRGLYQETILPNIAFIGGGGETAYWLQLKELFQHYKTPFPILLLRNSFLVVEKKWREKMTKLDFTAEDFFLPEQELLNKLVARDTSNAIKLNGSLSEVEQLYENFKKQAGAVDSTLVQHVDALKNRTVYQLQELEKKMLRAEKRKFTDQQRQIATIKNQLFPSGGLQERYENICSYYAKWGKDIISEFYRHSLALEQEFVILNIEA